MTLAECIASAQSESPETFELAAFLDLGVFISFYMPELIKLPFGRQADDFIIVVSQNDDDARRVRDIKDAIEMKFPDSVGKAWVEKTTVAKNQTEILADSPGDRIRGALFNTWRPTIVVGIDLDDMSALWNPITAADDEKWFNSDLME